MIDGGEFDRGELADPLVDNVKFVTIVRGGDFGFEAGKLTENPSIQTSKFVVGDSVLRRIEILQIRKLIPERVADDTVRF